MPVARVCVDIGLAHLDRPFDYLVPAAAAADAQPGVRVRVRFAGKLVDGWLLERVAASDHQGRLAFLERVVSAAPALTADVAGLARAIADRYGGTMADVLRLAVPPRHARAEKALEASAPPPPDIPPTVGATASAAAPGWRRYPAGGAFLRAVAARRPARGVWSALPGEDWPTRLAELVAAVDGGALVVVPDARDLDRLDAACATVLGAGRHVCLSAASGPAARYRSFLDVLRGHARVVVGTRAAMFAPVPDLRLVVLWDDGDDLHAEPRAPYPHAREVLLTRAQRSDCAALVGGFSRTAEAQLLVETGWAQDIVADRATVRAAAPQVVALGAEPQLARDPAAATARLPSDAWKAAAAALRTGAPVLAQVPRRGYLPSVACQDCRAPARCVHCQGPLELRVARGAALCRWCGRGEVGHRCPQCGSPRLRASVVGARRTAEELGRAFPGAVVRTSGRDEILDQAPAGPCVVVATPGAEPPAPGGYGAVLLLDTWALLARADLRAAEEALRRWSAAAALARPAAAGGTVVIVADAALAPVQALVRWDQAWFAARELAERRELGFPPAARMASVTGAAAAVADLLHQARLPEGAELLGPVPAGADQERMLIRIRRGQAAALAAALHEAAAARSARKAPLPARIQIDPLELL
ncbi:primosomal protein N' [Pilimelia columellifera]|uniref:primosomal protein N' n=1 Tax=Pilimelia columellifera TaxID=706574 RepID=UPI0031D84663